MEALISEPIKIMGVTVYNPLPGTGFVDLDKECVIPIGGEIDPFDVDMLNDDLDRVVTAGVLPNGVHWGMSARSEEGFAGVLIDTVEVTEETIRQLIIAGIVTAPKNN